MAMGQKPVPKSTLVSGNMDQNLRNPSCLILTHTHILKQMVDRELGLFQVETDRTER